MVPHPDVHLESGDSVIFSSKIIPGNEKKLYHLQNLIVRNKMEMISERMLSSMSLVILIEMTLRICTKW